VCIPSLPPLQPAIHKSTGTALLGDTSLLRHRYPALRLTAWEYEFGHDWTALIDSSIDLLYELKRLRGSRTRATVPLFFIAHGVGSLLLKKVVPVC
jgi:hypothetical protein